jgi:hypothetical protein
MSCQDINKYFQLLLFSQYFCDEGFKRCDESRSANEECEMCGPRDRPCVDCYICIAIPCIGCDIITCPWRFTWYTKEKCCKKEETTENYRREQNL